MKMIGGRNLPAMDRNGKSDPYLIVHFKNQKFRTKVIKKTLNPTWNEEFIVKFTAEDLKNPSETFLLIEAFDWDEGIGGDDEMGFIEFSLKSFLEKPEQQGWYKIKPPKTPEKENEENKQRKGIGTNKERQKEKAEELKKLKGELNLEFLFKEAKEFENLKEIANSHKN